MMRLVDDSCSVGVQGELVLRFVPGCRITHRLRIDLDWERAFIGALQLVASIGVPEGREQDRLVNRYLDLLDMDMSGLERRVIFDNVTGRAEA